MADTLEKRIELAEATTEAYIQDSFLDEKFNQILRNQLLIFEILAIIRKSMETDPDAISK